MAKKSHHKPIKRLFLFNPLKRPLPYIGLIIAIVMIIFQSSIRLYTANLVGNWLVSNIREATQGNYRLDYDFVRFDIFTQELRIQNLNLELDTSVINKKTYLEQYSNLVNLSTPIVVIKLASLWDLLFNEKLRIAYIGIQEPNVSLIRSQHLTDAEIEINKQATSDSVRSFLQELEIDSFRVLNGAISVDFQDEHQQNILDFKIRNYTTLLKGFHVDQIAPGKLFQGIYAEEFELEVLDQEISIPAIHHKFSFERLWISSNDSLIQIDTLSIRPLASADSTFIGNIDLKQLLLSGLDFRKAQIEEILNVKKLVIDKPRVGLTRKGVTNKADNQLKQWRYMLFHKINIQNIALKDGAFNLNFNQNIRLNDLSISLNNYSIDSSYADLALLTRNISDFNISLGNSTLELPDSIHQLNFESLEISSLDSNLYASNMQLSPIAGRRKYKYYKSRGVKIVNYATIKEVNLSGINFGQLIENQQILADSLIIKAPRFSTTEFQYIKPSVKSTRETPFLINSILVTNGSMKYNKPQAGVNNRTQVNGIKLQLKKVFNSDKQGVDFEDLQFHIRDGFTQLKDVGHTLSFTNLRSDNLINYDIASLKFEPDTSSHNTNILNVSAQGLRIRGFDGKTIQTHSALNIDLIAVDKISIKGQLGKKNNLGKEQKKALLNNLKVNKIFFKDADISMNNQGTEIRFSDIQTNIDSIEYSAYDSTAFIPLMFKDLKLTHGEFLIRTSGSGLSISGSDGQYQDIDSTLQLNNIRLKSGNNITSRLDKLVLGGVDRDEFMKNKAVKFGYLFLDQPDIKLLATGKNSKPGIISIDSLKSGILEKISFIEFDSIITKNGNLNLSADKRNITLSHISSYIGSYRLDTLTRAAELFSPEKLDIRIGSLSTTSSKDTVTVQNISLDMINNRLITSEITARADLDSSHLQVNFPGLVLAGFKTINLLNRDFSLDTIRMSSGNVEIIIPKRPKSREESFLKTRRELNGLVSRMFQKKTNPIFDTLFQQRERILYQNVNRSDTSRSFTFNNLLGELNKEVDSVSVKEVDSVSVDFNSKQILDKLEIPTHGVIKHIGLSNTSITIKEKQNPISLIDSLNVHIYLDHLVLDTNNQFNVFNHINDINLRLSKYDYKLPDSLNTLSFNQVNISSKKEQILIDGFQIQPRVSKYDYANLVGEQVTWQHIKDLDISIDKINFFELFVNKRFKARKISTRNGTIDIFKEKVQPIPVNRRRPMPQDALKNIDMPILIDSLSVEDFRVNFTTRKNPEKPEGSINFHEINVLATNIVNTDSAITMNPYMTLQAKSKIMGKGMLTANFNFDMNDEHNGFIFDAQLEEMSAREFNGILEAMASVSIESGNIQNISLSAAGDNDYATGNMRFEYTDLKVSTINKKTLKTTGMGKVIKTFFANAFVVKKNNPTFKIFPRDGAMYYERDPQKIIIDYVAKTAISGIISSIGARDARKDIKRIQKESKKQKDDERKALKRRGSID